MLHRSVCPRWLCIVNRLFVSLLLLFAPVFGSCGATSSAGDAPEHFVTHFYKNHLHLHISGLPSPEELVILQSFLTPDLIGAIEAARRQQQAAMKKYPGEKPPWIEGDLFSSLFE